MKTGDFVVIGIIISIAIGIFFATGRELYYSDPIAVVTIDGKEYKRYHLKNMEEEVVIETEYGRNVLHFSKGSVCIEEADCKDKTCMKMAKISKPGEIIVCLPNRLIIEIVSEDNTGEELDVILK